MAYNILVVDDSRVMRRMIIKTLHMSGLHFDEVHQAGNGVEGLKALEDNWIDLALVDINMPVMNGQDMIDHVRANPKTVDLPVIVVSTEASETRIEQLKAKGARFVHKPFNPQQFFTLIKDMTGVSDDQQFGDSDLPSGDCDF